MDDKSYRGPLFMTMFTITGLRVIPPDGKDDPYGKLPIYELETKEGSTIMCGRHPDGSCGVQVVGPVGASPREYSGPEADRIVEYAENAERSWPLEEVQGPADQGKTEP